MNKSDALRLLAVAGLFQSALTLAQAAAPAPAQRLIVRRLARKPVPRRASPAFSFFKAGVRVCAARTRRW